MQQRAPGSNQFIAKPSKSFSDMRDVPGSGAARPPCTFAWRFIIIVINIIIITTIYFTGMRSRAWKRRSLAMTPMTAASAA